MEPEPQLRGDVAAVLKVAAGGPVRFGLVAMPRHASSRRYYRVRVEQAAPGLPRTLVAMRLGADPFRSDELTGPAPPPDELPFVAVHRVLEGRGLRVPRVYGHDASRRLVLVEDLGDHTLRDRLRTLGRASRLAAYARAVDVLGELQREGVGDPAALPFSRRFDLALLRRELDHFRAWGLEAAWGPPPADVAASLEAGLDALAARVAGQPRALVHRDFNSRNLMWTDEDELVMIDFQDALVGPATYDLASILCDSYATLDEPTIERLVARFAARIGVTDVDALRAAFWSSVAQRKLKDAGRFVFIDRVRGNAAFLRWYAPSLVHVARALRNGGAPSTLADVLTAWIPGFPGAPKTPRADTGAGRSLSGRDPE